MSGHPYCSSINSTQFNVEHENTCSFDCHIASSIPTFHSNNFLYKTSHIKNQIFNKKSYRNIFFILLLYYTLTENLYENALPEKVALFFKLENFNFSISTYSTKLIILLKYCNILSILFKLVALIE